MIIIKCKILKFEIISDVSIFNSLPKCIFPQRTIVLLYIYLLLAA